MFVPRYRSLAERARHAANERDQTAASEKGAT